MNLDFLMIMLKGQLERSSGEEVWIELEMWDEELVIPILLMLVIERPMEREVELELEGGELLLEKLMESLLWWDGDELFEVDDELK